MVLFIRYHPDKSITMLNLYYHKLIGKTEENEGKKLIVDDYTLDKVLDKIKKISIKKLDDKLQDDITLKNPVISMTCIIKGGDKFYSQIL